MPPPAWAGEHHGSMVPVVEKSSTTAFRAARDALAAHAGDHEAARAAFRWPEVGDSFNWAVDWFDVIARDNDRVALWIVDQDGVDHRVTFDEMRRRSDQVASWLVERGVAKGDHVMLCSATASSCGRRCSPS